MRYAIPLIVFLVIAGFLASRLFGGYDPHFLPSVLIGKPAPEFQLPELRNPTKTFSPKQLRGQVWLLNVWGSWCFACREEHPFLIQLSESGTVLDELGDPYIVNASDAEGRVAIDYGVTGAPETYLIDKNGVIRYKEVGQLNAEIMQNKILPLIKELNK
jgi:cytochrome c biogenesis protein CcmG/thiol:disulfide interchange protein DsbE